MPLKYHPLPWSVTYYRRCPEWDERTNPYVVDADGNEVVQPPQHVGHPGEYDEQADFICTLICASVNAIVGRVTEAAPGD